MAENYTVKTDGGEEQSFLFPHLAVLKAICDGGMVFCRSVKFAVPIKADAEKWGGEQVTPDAFRFKASSKKAVEYATANQMLLGT